MITQLRIGPALVLPLTRQVFIDGVEQRLGGRAFDLLMALAAQPEGIISKEHLYETVWQDRAVEPNNLQVQVWALRRIFGNRAIATVPRRGYRLVLPVVPLAASALRALVQQRMQTLRWVTLVSSDDAVRRAALQFVRTQWLTPAGPVWRWRSGARGDTDSALWQRVNAVGGLIVADNLDTSSAALLQVRHHAARPAPRVLAGSAEPLAAVSLTNCDVSALGALLLAGNEQAVRLRQRAGLVRSESLSAI